MNPVYGSHCLHDRTAAVPRAVYLRQSFLKNRTVTRSANRPAPGRRELWSLLRNCLYPPPGSPV